MPYKGEAQAMIDLVSGQVSLLFASIGSAMPIIQRGQIKALGVTSATREAMLPSVPTIAEQGLPGYEMNMWFALIAPAQLPAEIAKQLGSALKDTLSDTTVQSAIRRQGYEPRPATPQQLHDRIQSDLAKWSKVIRDRKLSLELLP